MIFNSVCSSFIGKTINDINDKLTQSWPNDQSFDLEIELVIHTVAFAILNPSKDSSMAHSNGSNHFNSEQTQWDVTRFADNVKNTKVKETGESQSDQRLPIYFPQAKFGKVVEPATILDLHGRVMVWALPGVLHPGRLVGNSLETPLYNFNCYNRRTFTKQQEDSAVL
jgi:hypothetical protein